MKKTLICLLAGCCALATACGSTAESENKIETQSLIPAENTEVEETTEQISVEAAISSVDDLANYPATEESLFFTQEEADGSVTVRGYDGADPVIVIPETIGGKKVARINAKAFDGEDSLEAIKIPQSVKVIENEAFCFCKNLRFVIVEGELETIETNAFMGAEKLETIQLKGVENIGEQAFYACESLEEIILPEGLKEIEKGAFDETGISKIILPASLELLGAHSMPKGLTECEIRSAVLNMEENLSFIRCQSLTLTYPSAMDQTALEEMKKFAEEEGNTLNLQAE